jgi:hypothetical protein
MAKKKDTSNGPPKPNATREKIIVNNPFAVD